MGKTRRGSEEERINGIKFSFYYRVPSFARVIASCKESRDSICSGMYARLEKRSTHLSKLPFV